MATQVKLPKDVSGAAFAMLGQYAYGSQPQLMTDASLERVQMSTKAIGKPWSTVTGYGDALRALAEQSRQKTSLLGGDQEAQKQVEEWLQFLDADGGSMTDAKLQKVNEHLRTRNYLAGHAITVADFAVFAAAHPAVSSFSQQQIEQHVNLVRWFDHIQHTADSHNTHTKVGMQKPPFRPPLPPAPAARDKAADKGKGSTDSKAAAAPGPAPQKEAAVVPPTSDASAAAAPSTEQNGVLGGGKKEKKAKKEKPPAAPAVKEPASITALDIRVGKIMDVENHPDAEKLYVEKIDLGEAEPRTIVSGLRNFVSLEDMRGRRVVVLANLKPAKLVGIPSAGMVLCSSNEDHTAVDPILPPEGAAIGERITFEGHEGEPEAQLNPKKKVFEELAPSLKTNADGIAVYQDIKFMTSAGPLTSKLPNGSVR